MKQEGGVHERGTLSLDVARTPFGSYDAALIAAVQQRWYDLLDATRFAQRSGKVVLEFRLYYDGRITDMKVDGNEVGEMLGLLCQRAITDPAPFAQWPSDMRRAIGKNYRDVMFTFYYN
jgi:membrane protein involved in colicin uptake